MTYDEGKVYLRDVRNGTIYPYERFLAADRNFKPYIPNPVKAARVSSQTADSSSTLEQQIQDGAAHEPLANQL